MKQSTDNYFEFYLELSQQLQQGQLGLVLSKIKDKATELEEWEILSGCEQLRQTYSLLLKYFRQGVNDPMRGSVYIQLKDSCILLLDRLRRKMGQWDSPSLYYQKLRTISRRSRTLLYYINRLRQIHQNSLFLSITGEDADSQQERQALVDELFDFIWTNDSLTTEQERQALTEMFTDDYLQDAEKQWIVSAITLSVLYYWDVWKLSLLTALCSNSDPLVASRALVGLALVCAYDKGHHGSAVWHALHMSISNFSSTWCLLQSLFLNLALAKRIKRQIDTEFMPNIMALQKDMDVQQLQECLEDEEVELPEGIDQELLDKVRSSVQQMSQQAQQGIDMYYSVFSTHHHQPQFHEVREWFRPFSLNRHKIDDQLHTFLAEIDMCDSDKNSFVAILSLMPKEIVNQFKSIAPDLKSNDNPLSLLHSQRRKHAERLETLSLSSEPKDYLAYASLYMQDLYRFFTLKIAKEQEANPFHATDELDIISLDCIREHLNPADLSSISRFAYNQRHYLSAATLLTNLGLCRKLTNSERLMRAFSKFMLKDYYNAALMFEEVPLDAKEFTPEWKAVYASVLVNNDQIEQAIEIYSSIYNEGASSSLTRSYATALIECGDYQEALDILFMEDFLHPGQIAIQQLLSECLLETNNPQDALNYLFQILDSDHFEPEDHLLCGHALLALNRIEEALEHYRIYKQSLKEEDRLFSPEDLDLLLRVLSVDPIDIVLVEEAV